MIIASSPSRGTLAPSIASWLISPRDFYALLSGVTHAFRYQHPLNSTFVVLGFPLTPGNFSNTPSIMGKITELTFPQLPLLTPRIS